MPPRTIDNLGPDASSRYADDRKHYDETQIKESRIIPSQAEIDVTAPAFSSEFELLFETSRRNSPWGDFFMPPRYQDQKKRVFTFQILPSLGSPDKKEVQAERIQQTVALAKKRKDEAEEATKNGLRSSAREEIKELEEEEKEKSVLLKLFDGISNLERTLIDINSRRSQYHKG
jgi:hypothetical protein